ncbi:hypothetical protein [Phytoactinopolyspora limicola]|uniref:hypothetical protein n=1 Tax=Phytoactinopolyspora limicola TaxID=2715536 RepID=UPI001409567A|nr:hypothetical protein [Phytoactinopolyspora limicola]
MSTFRRVLTVSAAAAVVAVLPACDPDQVGMAVSVGDSRLSVSDLQDRVTEIVESRNTAIDELELPLPALDPGGDLAELQRQELSRWINREVYQAAGREQDVTIHESEVDAFLDEFAAGFPDSDITPFLAEQGYTEDSVRDDVQVALIAERLTQVLGSQAEVQLLLQDTVERIGVDVSPRYGTWGIDGLEPGTGSVSVPVDEDHLDDGGLHDH